MSSKLLKKTKLSRKNRYGKCDWKVELEVHEGRMTFTETQYWLKYTEEALEQELKSTCNCTL